MCWTQFKNIGHSSKNLGPSQKTFRPSWCPKLVAGLVTGTMCHCNEHKLSALHGWRLEKNRNQRYDETVHTVTAKRSGNALKNESRTQQTWTTKYF